MPGALAVSSGTSSARNLVEEFGEVRPAAVDRTDHGDGPPTVDAGDPRIAAAAAQLAPPSPIGTELPSSSTGPGSRGGRRCRRGRAARSCTSTS